MMSLRDFLSQKFLFRAAHVVIFGGWIFAVGYALNEFYSSDVRISIIYGTKVIKLVSLLGILLHLTLWLVGAVKEAVIGNRATWPYPTAAAVVGAVTVVIGGAMGIELVRAYDKAAGGENVFYTVGEIGGVIWDNSYPLIPIVGLMFLNMSLIKARTTEVSSEARSYLQQIDLPCIVTSAIVFSVAYLSDGYADLRELAFALGGAMSFLVFLVFFNEFLLGILKKY